MKHLYTLLVIFFIANSSFSQYSIAGGLTQLNPLDFNRNWFTGLNLIAEIPIAEDESYLGKFTVFLPKTTEVTQEVIDPSNNTSTGELQVVSTSRESLFSLDVGRRRYFFNTYDVGPALYAGLTLKGTVNTFSETNVIFNEQTRGYGIILTTYGYAGFKYQLPHRSALFFDAGFDLRLLGIGQPTILPGFFFTMNVGYRYDLF